MSAAALAVVDTLDRASLDIHRTSTDGASIDWGMSLPALRILAAEVSESSVTAETGCGLSTLVLGSTALEHHCFTLLDSERARIETSGERMGLDLSRVSFHVGDSLATLADADLPRLDIAVLDGAHAFPYPVAEWSSLGRGLRPGGLLAVDDVWIPSVGSLTEFLDCEPEWRVLSDDSRTAFYRREDPLARPSAYPDGWDLQGMNMRVAQRFIVMQGLALQPTFENARKHPVLFSRRLVGAGLQRARSARKARR